MHKLLIDRNITAPIERLLAYMHIANSPVLVVEFVQWVDSLEGPGFASELLTHPDVQSALNYTTEEPNSSRRDRLIVGLSRYRLSNTQTISSGLSEFIDSLEKLNQTEWVRAAYGLGLNLLEISEHPLHKARIDVAKVKAVADYYDDAVDVVGDVYSDMWTSSGPDLRALRVALFGNYADGYRQIGRPADLFLLSVLDKVQEKVKLRQSRHADLLERLSYHTGEIEKLTAALKETTR